MSRRCLNSENQIARRDAERKHCQATLASFQKRGYYQPVRPTPNLTARAREDGDMSTLPSAEASRRRVEHQFAIFILGCLTLRLRGKP